MDSSIEVNRSPAAAEQGKAGQGMEGLPSAVEQRPARADQRHRVTKRGAPGSRDRLSVDPMRSTDRYRLVLPIVPEI